MTISIITAVKDDVENFKLTFESIMNQNIKISEWIVVDSSTGSEVRELCKGAEIDFLEYIFSEPKGIYPAMNLGIQKAHHKWLFFLNAGDYFLKHDSLQQVLNQLDDSDEFNLVAFPVEIHGSNNRLLEVIFPIIKETRFGKEGHFNHQGVFFQRITGPTVIYYDENLKFAADGKYIDEYLRHGICKINRVAHTAFRLGGTSGKNFIATVEEIQTYRLLRINKLQLLVLLLKTRSRRLIYSSPNFSQTKTSTLLHHFISISKKFRRTY